MNKFRRWVRTSYIAWVLAMLCCIPLIMMSIAMMIISSVSNNNSFLFTIGFIGNLIFSWALVEILIYRFLRNKKYKFYHDPPCDCDICHYQKEILKQSASFHGEEK
jgi:hypothetical protein